MFITRGIPTVCGYGVTHGGVHGADEWADLESLCNTTEVYAHAILHFLGEDNHHVDGKPFDDLATAGLACQPA